jgi:Holliday junction resolvase RusA-like endonuclease
MDGDTMMIQFTIPGDPIAVQSARFTSGKDGTPGHSYQKKSAKNWKALVRACVYPLPVLLEEPVVLEIHARFKRPKNWPKKGKPCVKSPDVDNLCKGIADALNKHIWTDDRYIVRLLVTKEYAPHGVEGYTSVIIRPAVSE